MLMFLGMSMVCWLQALTITREHFGFNDASQRNYRQGGWDSSSTDTSEGSGKTWSFTLPTTGYVNNTYHHVNGASGYPNANISCYYTQYVNGYSGSGYNYYQDNGEDILNLGYTGAPNTVWNPPIPNGLPHYQGKTWQGTHAYTYGSYSVQGKVISEGTISTHLGSYAAVCVRYYYSTTSLSYYCYQWESAEYGIMAYALTINGGMLYVLYEADANQVSASDAAVPQVSGLSVSPNPVYGVFRVAFQQSKAAPVLMNVDNLSGQIAFKKNFNTLPAGENELTADIITQGKG